MKTFQTFDISAEYDAIHRTFPCHKDAPVIGLTGNFQEGACTLLEGYFTSILKAGGIPFIIPPVDETNSLINSLNALDAITPDDPSGDLCCVIPLSVLLQGTRD